MQQRIMNSLITIERLGNMVGLDGSRRPLLGGSSRMEVVKRPSNGMRRLWHNYSSNGHLTCNGSTASEPDDDHFTGDNGPTLSDKEVNGREAHSDGHDGNGDAFERARESKKVSLRFEFEDGFAAIKVFGDSSGSGLVAYCDDAVGYLARTGADMVCGLGGVHREVCVGEGVLHAG